MTTENEQQIESLETVEVTNEDVIDVLASGIRLSRPTHVLVPVEPIGKVTMFESAPLGKLSTDTMYISPGNLADRNGIRDTAIIEHESTGEVTTADLEVR